MPEKILKPRLCREAIIPNNLVLCYLVQVETVSESVSESVSVRESTLANTNAFLNPHLEPHPPAPANA